ncbi:MAG: anthranilate phosphoribosyltransferase [Fuerstiella sp.]|nr:anthranilate phosphoribosyltransferase [Fuerstiella sp.]MCP4859080.1 anthranilate phosphoribosyltransferase [Fuerstiella sp.]
MNATLRPALQQLISRQDLSCDTVQKCIGAMMDGACDAADMAAWLTAMACKGPAAIEVVGAAQAMRDRAARIATERRPLLDTCGTGGDQLHTFNISTATAIVAAACGVNVAKHGNRSVSSSSGSADVLEALNVNIQLTPEQAAQCLDEIGITFCFAPLVHGAMKHAAPVRKALGIPTIFNLLGPLTNPAGAEYQLLGASSDERARLLASALSVLGCRKALVVCGNNELDEVCLWGPTTVYEVKNGQVAQLGWTCDDFGLPVCDVAPLRVNSSAESAAMIQSVLDGEDSPAANIVIANTAAALLAAEKESTLTDAVTSVRMTLTDGLAAGKLNDLREWTQAVA